LESIPETFEVREPVRVDAEIVARALALLDEGRVAEAQALLASALAETELLASAPFARSLDGLDRELDRALEGARPETDAMIDADGIAFEAIRRAKLNDPEGLAVEESADFAAHEPAGLAQHPEDFAASDPERVAGDELPAPGSPLHTRTLADLLERQGDSASARSVRSALATRNTSADMSAEARTRTIETLERWLGRLRGGEA
jgi:hypothetical protein